MTSSSKQVAAAKVGCRQLCRNNHRRASGIGGDLSADRPEQHSGEAAVTAATHNQEIGTL
jgi:hypothetical protein